MDAATRKDGIRRVVLSKRGRIDPSERAEAAEQAAERALSLPALARARTILAYASFGTEIATDPLVGRALAAGLTVLLPYVAGPGRLEAAPIDSLADLAPGYRGIREPARREPTDASAAEVAIVPGVAFDPSGARLGYGGGFYDRFLAALPRSIPRIGLAFDLQIVERIPREDFDQDVDWVVTQARTIECRA